MQVCFDFCDSKDCKTFSVKVMCRESAEFLFCLSFIVQLCCRKVCSILRDNSNFVLFDDDTNLVSLTWINLNGIDCVKII